METKTTLPTVYVVSYISADIQEPDKCFSGSANVPTIQKCIEMNIKTVGAMIVNNWHITASNQIKLDCETHYGKSFHYTITEMTILPFAS